MKEGEMERMEKERLIRELEMVRLEQEKMRKEEEERWFQEKMMKEQIIREMERLVKDLEKDRMMREQGRLQDEKELELCRRKKLEEQLREDEVLRLEKQLKEEEIARLAKLRHEENIRENFPEIMQQQPQLMPSQGKNQVGGNHLLERVEHWGDKEVERKVAQSLEPMGSHDVVEEQQRILEMILKEKREEELNQQLIRSLCSHGGQPHGGQPTPPQALVQSQPISRKNAQLANVQKGPNCWEKVPKRKKQVKCVNEPTADMKQEHIGEETFEVRKKKESEERERRGLRSNTHQKVILVPNFIEETMGPTNFEAEQDCSAKVPELSLANQRRREEAARRKAWDDRQEQRCLERGRRGNKPVVVKKPEMQLVDRRV